MTSTGESTARNAARNEWPSARNDSEANAAVARKDIWPSVDAAWGSLRPLVPAGVAEHAQAAVDLVPPVRRHQRHLRLDLRPRGGVPRLAGPARPDPLDVVPDVAEAARRRGHEHQL